VRRIDLQGQIKMFAGDVAMVDLLLSIVSTNMKFLSMNQQIRFYAVMPLIDSHGNEFKNEKSILLITSDFIMLLKIPDFFLLLNASREELIKHILLFSERISNITYYNCRMTEPTVKNESFKSSIFFLLMVFKKPGQYLNGPKRIMPASAHSTP